MVECRMRKQVSRMTMTPLFSLLLVLECSLAAGFQTLQTTRLFLLIILTRNTNLKPELVAYKPPESYQPFIPLFLGHDLNQRCYEIAPAACRGHAPPLRPPVRRQRLGARPPAPRPPGVPAVQDGAAGEARDKHCHWSSAAITSLILKFVEAFLTRRHEHAFFK